MAKKPLIKIDVISGRALKAFEMVAVEENLDVYVNGEHYATFLTSPAMERELVVGHMLSEGLIKSIDDLGEIQFLGKTANLSLKKNIKFSPASKREMKIHFSSYGSYTDLARALEDSEKHVVASDLKLKATNVLRMIKRVERVGKVYKTTRGVHSAALFSPDTKLVSFSEDVGRHNAVDKVIGDAALKRENFSKLTLVSSGRQSAHMVLKAARVGIPIIASIASPILSGVIAAEKAGITLLSVQNMGCMKVYTFQERVLI